MKLKKGDYLRNKELGTISVIEFDLYDVGQNEKPSTFYQLRVVSFNSDGATHGSYIGSTYWKSTREIEEIFDLVNKFNVINKYKKSMSTILRTMKKISRKEPEKSFIKAGFMNDSEELTESGVEALIYILLKEKIEEMKKLANEVIEENKVDK